MITVRRYEREDVTDRLALLSVDQFATWAEVDARFRGVEAYDHVAADLPARATGRAHPEPNGDLFGDSIFTSWERIEVAGAEHIARVIYVISGLPEEAP